MFHRGEDPEDAQTLRWAIWILAACVALSLAATLGLPIGS